MAEEKSIPVSKNELEDVLATMIRYQRRSGYMGKRDEQDKLRFFDSEPDFGAAPVTREELANWIAQHSDNDI